MSLEALKLASVEKSMRPAVLFLKRWIANPLAVASIVPSSASLARVIVKNIQQQPDEIVVELGGGTGSITEVLLASGIPASNLYSVERDPELAAYMRRALPEVGVLEGDVRNIRAMLPPAVIGKVGTVIVCIPMVLLPWQAQQEIVDHIFSIMPEGRRFFAYTYSIGAPLKYKKLGLNAERVGFTLANVPPASVWAFSKC